MSEEEVQYSNVKFTNAKETVPILAEDTSPEDKNPTPEAPAEQHETASSSAEAAHSEVKISTTEASVELRGSQQEGSIRRSKVTERALLLVLCVLLAAALIALGVLTADYLKTKKHLQTQKDSKNLSNEPCPKCEEGWELHGGKCYYFSTNKSTWNQSRDDCRRGGGDLVKIDSREEQSFLECRLRKKMNEDKDKFWIGLTDSKEEGKWLWVDDSPLNTSFLFWNDTQPDNYSEQNKEFPEGEDCVVMGKKREADDLKCWFDVFCAKSYKSICEKSV